MAKRFNRNDGGDRDRWTRPRQRRGGLRFGPGEIRLTILAGMFLGLGAAAYLPSSGATGFSGDSGGNPVEAIGDVRVIDGDTFDLAGERIRIADIDTPEVDGRCAYESDLASRATTRMRALLSEGPFELHPIAGRDEDRYGRKLRIVTRGGRSLGDTLVAEGLARTWTGRREPWCV